MARLSFHTYDVFTDRPYAGNPLAIVEGADDLSDAQMQTIAREFNLSETIFVQRPDDPNLSAKVRIFFPTAEIPFAGHPTIGCAIHLATAAAEEGDFATLITLEEVAGLVPVDVSRRDGRITAEFTAPVLPHPHDGETSLDLAASALGLSPSDIGFDTHRPALFAGGPAFLYVPMAGREALKNANPQEPAWSDLMAAGRVDSAYLYHRTAEASFTARMFSPTAGIPEDPATGSASAILAAQLLAAEDLSDGETRISLRQGEDMGRPSDITVTATVAHGALTQVRAAGSAVPISSGTLSPPVA